MKDLIHSERNWTEDFSHENGNYQCNCTLCKQQFIGHKRRVVCKICANKFNEKKSLSIIFEEFYSLGRKDMKQSMEQGVYINNFQDKLNEL